MFQTEFILPGTADSPPSSSVGSSESINSVGAFREAIAGFSGCGRPSVLADVPVSDMPAIPVYINEFWTARQRQAHSLHEISYRACFKPQLPRFFIERLTAPGQVVYDPFMGRGTTPIEAALLGRVPWGGDVNPLSLHLTRSRLFPPTESEVRERLRSIDWAWTGGLPDDLQVFYHPATLAQIMTLRRYLLDRRALGQNDAVDDWITTVALNRLTGHSPGFFSVYTLPPNQAVSVASQRRINAKRVQVPPRRDVARIILRKTAALLKDCDTRSRASLAAVAAQSSFHVGPAHRTPELPSGQVRLVVTSPPFLHIVQYAADNWLRCWFVGIDAETVPITMLCKPEDWQQAMSRVFVELERLLAPGGWVAFEVGEVLKGTLRLEDLVVPCGVSSGLEPVLVMVNDQRFTKTANCWGVDNNSRGTNSNRIVVFRKPGQERFGT